VGPGPASVVRISWEQHSDGPRLVMSGAGGTTVRVDEPIRLCLTDGSVVRADYQRVERHGDGWTATGTAAAAAAAGDPDLLRIAEIVGIGMQGALSMPSALLGYAHPGIQCEGLMTSYWLSDPDPTEFSGAVGKRKGDDNDTCNGLTNGQAAYGVHELLDTYGTADFGRLRAELFGG
jgi:hypothetical protein